MSVVGALAGEKYISLTTFKQDRTPLATPVWVVSDDGRRLLVWTGPQTWKIKRLRRDPRVVVSASDFRGRTWRVRRGSGEASRHPAAEPRRAAAAARPLQPACSRQHSEAAGAVRLYRDR
jgi:PPOX class probable F420-dependent enzyme